MTSNDDGMGGNVPDTRQTDCARANASRPFGSGALLGERSARDITQPPPVQGRAPSPAPRPKHQPPRQALANRRSGPPSNLAVRRTGKIGK